MRPSSSLSIYKKILHHIHPQLPLSLRDSNRLLGVLKNTFHKQLDLEHPFPASGPPQQSIAVPRFAVASGAKNQRAETASASSYVSASQHLATILAHPQFGGEVTEHSASLAKELQKCTQACRKFEQSAHKHAATHESATMLLSAILGRANWFNVQKSAREYIKQTQVTQTVLKYLQARHCLTSSAIKQNPLLFEALISCLVAEGRHGLVEKWIVNAPSPNRSHADARAVDTYSRRWLLDVLLRAETQQMGLETSVARFSRRLDSLERFCRANGMSEDEQSTIVQPALTALTQSLTDARNGESVSREVYDRLVSSLGSPAGDPAYLVQLARLKLYHPSQPDATSMLGLLQTLDPVPTPTDELWRVQLKTLVQWAVDASKLLSRQGNAELADWALQFAKRICAAAQVDWDQVLQRGSHRPLGVSE